jgi:uncharacterized protein
MMQDDVLKPLSESEYDRLADILAALPDPKTMNLEELDGYFAAVVSSPDEMPLEEILAHVWGGELSDQETFADEVAMAEFVVLTLRHWHAVLRRLEADDEFVPLLLENEAEDTRGHDWANGFVRGMALNPDEWTSLFEDEEMKPVLIPILTLAYEHDPDPNLRPSGGPLSPEEREILLHALAAAVPVIFDFFGEQDEFEEDIDEPSLVDSTPYQRETPKVGRNAPCPCGSGKKYKRCCGADAG